MPPSTFPVTLMPHIRLLTQFPLASLFLPSGRCALLPPVLAFGCSPPISDSFPFLHVRGVNAGYEVVDLL